MLHLMTGISSQGACRSLCANPGAMPNKTPLVGLLTDFGLRDQYVGVMKAAIASVCPAVRIIDVTHDVEPHNVREGAYLLWASYKYFAPGSILVGVIDPGVGGSRDIIAARSDTNLFLAPNNGLLDLVLWEEGVQEVTVIRLERPATRSLLPKSISSTFHGRDIFAPLAGHLAKGTRLESLGVRRPVDWLRRPFAENNSAEEGGIVLHVDRFGNVITNIKADFPGVRDRSLILKTGKRRIVTWVENYESITAGEACLMVGSSGLVEIVQKERSAATHFGLAQDDRFDIAFKEHR